MIRWPYCYAFAFNFLLRCHSRYFIDGEAEIRAVEEMKQEQEEQDRSRSEFWENRPLPRWFRQKQAESGRV